MFILYCRRVVLVDLRLAGVVNNLCREIAAINEERDLFVEELDTLVGWFLPKKTYGFVKETQTKDMEKMVELLWTYINDDGFGLRAFSLLCVSWGRLVAAERGASLRFCLFLAGPVLGFWQAVHLQQGFAVVCKQSLLPLSPSVTDFSFPFWGYSWFFTGSEVARGAGGSVPVFQEDEPATSDGIFYGSAGLYFSTSSLHGCPVILSSAGVKKVRGDVPEFQSLFMFMLVIVASAVNPVIVCAGYDDLISGFKGKNMSSRVSLIMSGVPAEVAKDLQKLQEFCRLSSELREVVRMRDQYIDELKMLSGCDEILESIKIKRRMQLNDMEKASHLLLMARETQSKLYEKNTFIVKLRGLRVD
ncbi:hypothetical protein Tco_0701377 [Tanacetum coccineum]